MEDGELLCFPLLINTSCRRPPSPWPESLLVDMVSYPVAVLIVALNLLVIISISHFRQLHTPTNILLLSLAVSDLLVGLLVMTVELQMKGSCWLLGESMCSLLKFVSFTVTSASVGDMVLISLDRYVAICDPLRYGTRVTEGRVKVCVCVCWLSSVVYCSFFMKDDLLRPGRLNSCDGECVVVIGYVAGAVDLVVTFVVPITAIVVLYTRVFVVAVSQARAMRRHVPGVTLQLSVTVNIRRSELKAARTLSVIVLIFLFCFCPYFGLSLAGLAGGQFHSSSDTVVMVLLYFNSCLNPLIYALFYPWFRKAVTLIVNLQILQPGSCQANVL